MPERSRLVSLLLDQDCKYNGALLTFAKLSSPKRIAFLVRPDDIDGVFRRLGASPMALDLSKRIVPESSPNSRTIFPICLLKCHWMS